MFATPIVCGLRNVGIVKVRTGVCVCLFCPVNKYGGFLTIIFKHRNFRSIACVCVFSLYIIIRRDV